MKRAAAPATLLLAALACGSAQAALWGYVDGAGVAHVADRPLDSRYQLVLGEGDERRVPGKADEANAMLTWLEIAPEVKALAPWLREAADANGIDAELLKAVIAVESGFNAAAVSPRGAIGLMQITARSAERYVGEGVRPVAQRLREPHFNIDTGARMLADLLRRLGRVDLALAAWNAGEGAVQRAGGLPPIEETQSHVHLVLELYWGLLQSSQARRATKLQLR